MVRKIWIPRAFKGHVSPHEFMQAVINASGKRFTIDKQADAIDFFQWLVNTLHMDLTGGKRKKRSIISNCLRGELEIVTLAGTGKAKGSKEDLVEKVPFLMLGLDLPPAPLFKDALENVIIPQVIVGFVCIKFGINQCNRKAGCCGRTCLRFTGMICTLAGPDSRTAPKV